MKFCTTLNFKLLKDVWINIISLTLLPQQVNTKILILSLFLCTVFVPLVELEFEIGCCERAVQSGSADQTAERFVAKKPDKIKEFFFKYVQLSNK